jgi:Kef-type K+ transport system membrane component KefB
MPSFGQLTLIILAGLAGPLLAVSKTLSIPVVVGELLAGVALGKTGAGLIKADNTTIAFLGNMGFAVLMMEAGMRVPLRNKALLGSLRRGTIAVLVSGAIGLGGGLLIARSLGFGHPALWAVLLSTGRRRSCCRPSRRRGWRRIARSSRWHGRRSRTSRRSSPCHS